MKAKFLSWLRSLNLPSKEEWLFSFQTLSGRQKNVVIILLIVFIFSGLITLAHLNNKLIVEVPLSGGTLTEGIVGSPRFINPLLASSDADRDLTTLVYSGLFRLAPGQGYEADLAEKMERSEDGLVYTVYLKDNLKWHDGKPLTTKDILFTIDKAKNPNIKSAKRSYWDGVKAEIVDDKTIRFTLKKPYNFFPDNLTLGILPAHLWSKLSDEQFALTRLNIQPIGSGPYQISSTNEDSLGIPTSYELSPFQDFALTKAKISLRLNFYNNEDDLIKDLKSGKIDSAGSISPQVAEELKNDGKKIVLGQLPRIFGVFFNQSRNTALLDPVIRQALDLAVDKQAVIDSVLYGYGDRLSGPLPETVVGKSTTTEKRGLATAMELLEKNNWTINSDKYLVKQQPKTSNKKKSSSTNAKTTSGPMTITISTANIDELKKAAELIAKDWSKLGIKVNLEFFEPNDLNQERIKDRRYEALLFGQVLGHNYDPFPFWHSSQRLDPGLNISLYVNNKVDKLLENARESAKITDLSAEYAKVQKEIVKDQPAIFLYQPNYIYVLPAKLKGVELPVISNSSDRWSQVHRWHLKTDRVWSIFSKLQ